MIPNLNSTLYIWVPNSRADIVTNTVQFSQRSLVHELHVRGPYFAVSIYVSISFWVNFLVLISNELKRDSKLLSTI